MSQPTSVPSDPLIDEVRETRARLIREHGGLRGWVQSLQEQQRRHSEKLGPAKSSERHRKT